MLTVWLLTAPARADWPLGADIPGAINADVTPEGLDALTGLIPGLVPGEIAVPEVHLYDYDEVCVFGFCTLLWEYALDVTNGTVYVTIDAIDIEPATGVLNLTAFATLSVNDSADPLYLDLDASLTFISANESCNVWVDPVQIELTAAIALTLLPDGTIDATVPPPSFDWTLNADDIILADCLIGDVVDVLDWVGIEPYDLLIDQITPEIESAVADLGPTIETALEDAFSSVSTIEGSVDLLGAPLDYKLSPSEITIVPDGIRIGMTSAFDTVPHPCVAQYGITESLATNGLAPPVGAWPDTIGYTPHLALNADDDMINQALFAVWQSGIICQTIDAEAAASLDLPIAIDTGLLDLLAPGVYDGLFESGAPLILGVAPSLPPVSSPKGAYDINVAMDGLGVDFLAELDGRIVRIVGIDLEVDAGADLSFDDASGLLAIAVQLGDDAITPAVSFNELVPDANATIVASFSNLFNSLVGPILTSALGDLSFPMPAFLGYGVTALDVAPTGNLDLDPSGAQGDRLGVFTTIGPVTYVATGCSCDSEDPYATSTCDTGTGRGVSLLGFATLALVARRRRR